MSHESVPEIPQASATGEIAEIYADILECQGAGLVNLIWRHLAIRPGALKWAWGCARSLYADGHARAGAAELERRLTLPALDQVPAHVFTALGLADDDVTTIARVIDSYNRGNALNLIALGAVVRGSPQGNHGSTLAAVAPPPAIGALPPIPALDALETTTQALVLELNGFGTRPADMPIVASLYRHLGPWPQYLALVWSQLAPLERDGRLRRSIVATGEVGSQVGAHLSVGQSASADAADVGFAREAITGFIDSAISRMVPIGLMLARSLGKR